MRNHSFHHGMTPNVTMIERYRNIGRFVCLMRRVVPLLFSSGGMHIMGRQNQACLSIFFYTYGQVGSQCSVSHVTSGCGCGAPGHRDFSTLNLNWE